MEKIDKKTGKVTVLKTDLKERGWTDSIIKKLYPEPEKEKKLHGLNQTCKIYFLEKVEEIEKTEEFQKLKEKAAIRSAKAKERLNKS